MITEQVQGIVDSFYSFYPDLERHDIDRSCIAYVLGKVRELLSRNHPVEYEDEGHFLYTLGYFDCLKDIDKIIEELEYKL